jgi:hypothetical protein
MAVRWSPASIHDLPTSAFCGAVQGALAMTPANALRCSLFKRTEVVAHESMTRRLWRVLIVSRQDGYELRE